jgi:hypothetical protein
MTTHQLRMRNPIDRTTRLSGAASTVAAVMLMLPFVAGCDDENPVVVDAPPFPPDGVFSVTGDGVVTLYWNPNDEPDLAGYAVWRGNQAPDGPYFHLADVSSNSTSYDDFDVVNGETWFYAVVAIDAAGNESELSRETVFDTPRPEGFNLVLVDLGQDPSHAGYDFSSLSNGSQAASLGTTDIYFENSGGVNYVVAASPLVDIQDYGVIALVGVDWAPETGWAPSKRAEAIVGHSYIVKIVDGQGDFNMAKFEVTNVTSDNIQMNWAYQAVDNILELSRVAPIGGAVR